MLMKTFCTNPLTVKNFTITFTPDFKKKQRQLYETEVMSFLNVPSEAEEEAMTQFIQQCATVVGQPRYPTKTLGEIEHYTGTRIYRVHSRKELIPRQITLFGRQIRCMYTKQPEYLAWLEKKKEQNRNIPDTDNETQSDDENNTDNKEDTDPTESDYESDKPVNKKRPTKIIITTENQIDYNTNTNKKQTENQIENIQNNTKRQVNKHLTNNNQNITQRKKRRSKTQNTSNDEEYWIDNLPPEFSEKNYSSLNNNNTQQNKNHKNKEQQSQTNNRRIKARPIITKHYHNKRDIHITTTRK